MKSDYATLCVPELEFEIEAGTQKVSRHARPTAARVFTQLTDPIPLAPDSALASLLLSPPTRLS